MRKERSVMRKKRIWVAKKALPRRDLFKLPEKKLINFNIFLKEIKKRHFMSQKLQS